MQILIESEQEMERLTKKIIDENMYRIKSPYDTILKTALMSMFISGIEFSKNGKVMVEV